MTQAQEFIRRANQALVGRELREVRYAGERGGKHIIWKKGAYLALTDTQLDELLVILNRLKGEN